MGEVESSSEPMGEVGRKKEPMGVVERNNEKDCQSDGGGERGG